MFTLRLDNYHAAADAGNEASLTQGGKPPAKRNEVWQSLALRSIGIQAKLAVSQPGDPYEREADHVADQVMQAASSHSSQDKLSLTSTSSLTAQRKCATCEEEEEPTLQRKAHGSHKGSPAIAPPIVHAPLGSPGHPVEPATRTFMESRFGHDFGRVRVHTDTESANAAQAVRARAYTIGRDIVFGAGEYAPASVEGQRLLAHELAHVVQQRDRATNQVQRAAAFGSMYQGKDGKVRSHLGKEYADYKAGLSATEASSMTGGHVLNFPITRFELLKIFTGIAKDLAAKTVDEATVDLYVAKLNQAFTTFKIDTVEAQASYIANAWRESDQFRYMTETEKAVSSNQPYQSDPTKVKLNTTWLNDAAAGKIPNVINYEPGGSINPVSDWQKSFIGRGPIQVTHRHFYVQAIAVMEKRAEELEASDPDSQDAKDLREAIDKIKTDPREAANPKYAFMFSAAFMKMPDTKGVRGDVKATKGQVTSWMGRQPADAKKDKEKAYAKAYEVLIEKYAEEQVD